MVYLCKRTRCRPLTKPPHRARAFPILTVLAACGPHPGENEESPTRQAIACVQKQPNQVQYKCCYVYIIAMTKSASISIIWEEPINVLAPFLARLAADVFSAHPLFRAADNSSTGAGILFSCQRCHHHYLSILCGPFSQFDRFSCER